MSPEQIKEQIVSAACSVASTRFYQESHEPGPYDDARREMDDDILTDLLHEWARTVGYSPIGTK